MPLSDQVATPMVPLRKGERVGFDHDEFGWTEGVIVRGSPNREEWLVRTPMEERWVRWMDLRPPRGSR